MRTSQQYIDKAAVTLSDKWHGEKVSLALFLKVLQNCMDALSELEAIKKTIFYGKELPFALQQLNLEIGGDTKFLSAEMSPQDCSKLAHWFSDERLGQVTIHGILGASAETGELLQILSQIVKGETELDLLKLAGEMGDVFWYFAVIALVHKFNFEQVQDMNIAKLMTRYPEGFRAYDALNRNVAKEESAMKKVDEVA